MDLAKVKNENMSTEIKIIERVKQNNKRRGLLDEGGGFGEGVEFLIILVSSTNYSVPIKDLKFSSCSYKIPYQEKKVK